MTYDVVVVGAGVVGLFAAYRLARRGLSVAVVEEREGPGLGVTSRQANVIHVVQPPPWSLKSRLCLRGNHSYFTWVREELDVKLRKHYTLIAATTRHGYVKLLTVYAVLRAWLPRSHRPRLLRWREAVELEPRLSDNVLAAIAIPGYGVADWRDVVSKLRRGLEELGVEQFYGEKLNRAQRHSGGYVLETSGGLKIHARFVVNAAGLYADEVAELLGHRVERIVARKGVILVYNTRVTENIVTSIEAPRGRTKGGAVIPQLDGSTYVGPNLAGATSKNDYSWSSRDVEELQTRFQPLVSVKLGKPSRIIVGLRPSTRRGDFIIKVTGDAVHLVGIESPGFTAAPAIAEHVEKIIYARLASGGKTL